jgi:hypothetical protein
MQMLGGNVAAIQALTRSRYTVSEKLSTSSSCVSGSPFRVEYRITDSVIDCIGI